MKGAFAKQKHDVGAGKLHGSLKRIWIEQSATSRIEALVDATEQIRFATRTSALWGVSALDRCFVRVALQCRPSSGR